ncbi:MAG: serine/threonine-protein kinase [Candidatus Obscuribacterales bacterium]|nr:serine/threonine-protein kinase [Candidatus Obscuribacterales bacterium]
MPQLPSEPEDKTVPSARGDSEGVGQVIAGKYQILSQLGKGGMGAVYKVRQIFLDEIFALKLLALSNIMSGVQLRRFQQEAKAARSLSHQNLVKVHDFGVLENEQPYLVMDYVDGPTLAEYLRTNGTLTVKQAKLLCTQLCSGLAHAHDKGIVHRDIKPSNIIVVSEHELGTEGSIKIVDFGIAKIMTNEHNLQQLTRTGEIFGSPFYMSPEQCLGTPVDQRSDIYSLGCVLFESLTGTPPFIGSNSLRTMVLHETAPIPSLKEASLSKEFPEAIERIVAKMLAKSPADRYETAHAAADDLSQSGLTSVTPTQVTKKDARTRVIKIVAGTAIFITGLFLLGVTATSFFQSTAPPKSSTTIKSDSTDEMINAVAGGVHTTASTLALAPRSSWTGQAITSKKLWKGANQVREFVFPSVPIGCVTTHLRKATRNWHQLEVVASGTRDFPANEPLTFLIDFEQFPKGFPGDYKYIGPDEFFGLHLKGSALTALFEDTMPVNQQKFMLSVLETAQHWKNLHAVLLEQVSLDDRWMRALDKMPNLENLLIVRPYKGFVSSKNYEFFHGLRRIWLNQTALEPFTDKLRGSSQLERLVVAECDITDKSIDNLADCTGLKELHFLQPKLGKNVLEHVFKLDQVEALNLSKTELSIAEVQNILHRMKIKKLVLSPDTYKRTREANFLDPRLLGDQSMPTQ